MQIGQAATVVAKGSPFFGERGTIVELADAERCVKVQMEHIHRIADVAMAPVALVFRFPLEQLELGPEAPPLPVDTEGVGVVEEESDGESAAERAPAMEAEA